jgi:hypothetical protein
LKGFKGPRGQGFKGVCTSLKPSNPGILESSF